MNKRVLGLFLGTVLLATFLRVYELTRIPNSLSADEASFAYNAYSILKTGKDEFGHFLPLYFQSFDDYKNPLYGYVLIPFIAAFGLNDWVIRFPSVLAGVAVVAGFFLLTRKLVRSLKTALLIALFGAICPWLIQYSRVAIEMELTLCISIFAVWAFLKGKTNPAFFIIASLLFTSSFYGYHASKVWVIGFWAVLFIVYKTVSKVAFFSLLPFFILILPYFQLLKMENIGLRPYAISVFSRQEEADAQAKLLLSDVQREDRMGVMIHNRRLTPFNQSVNGYLKILNPEILFGTSFYNQIPLTRLLFLWQLPLIIVGVYPLVGNPKLLVVLLAWIVIGLVPGGLTIFPPFDRRILLVSYPIILLSGLGLLTVLNHLKTNLRLKHIVLMSIVAGVFISEVIYMHNYFIHGIHTVVELWGNGMKELVVETAAEKVAYDNVFVSLKFNQALTFFLYYQKYPPEKYLREGGTISGGYLDERNQFDKYRFKFIQPGDLRSNTLYVWSQTEVQPCLRSIKTTSFTDGAMNANLGFFDPHLPGCSAGSGKS